MIIAVDARPLIEKKVGFGHFLENMLIAILEIDDKNQYILLSDREIFFDTEKYKNCSKIIYPNSLIFRKTFYYFYRLSSFIKREKIIPDVFWGTEHIMPNYLSKDCKKVLTLHDFTHVKFPESTTKYNLLISSLFYGKSIRNSNTIVCISNNSKEELQMYYPKDILGKQIVTVYEGGIKKDTTDQFKKTVPPSIRTKLFCDEKYILFVGTIEPRKNIRILIEAAPKLKEQGIKVVVCGKIGWEKPDVITVLNSTDNLIYFDYITNDEKCFLMSNALCQIQPSLYEGFGLPVVESMQLKTVVIVADNSSLRELVEMEELRFSTCDSNDLVNKVVALSTDRILYSKAKEYCEQRGRFFSWDKAAKEYLRIFTASNKSE